MARYQVAVEPLRSQRRVELVLLALSLLVTLQLLWLGLGRISSPGVTPVEPAADSLRVSPILSAGSITASESLALQARPLFWPERRPTSAVFANTAVEEADSTGRPARRLEKLELTGVFGSGEQSGAIVTHKGKRMRLLLGDELEGWTLQSVQGGDVVFVSAGARDVKRLMTMPVLELPANAVPEPADGASETAAATRAGSSPAAPGNEKTIADNKTQSSKTTTTKPAGTLSLGGGA
ncbi:MAG: hypothetical protein Cons2KO_06960 [Congregibacter sp.]